MRLVNIFAALSGLAAVVMLAMAAHALAPEDAARVQTGGYIQLAAAATGIAIANRSGVLNMIAGALILGGAALFAGALYAISLTHAHGFGMLAPIGGVTLMLGWGLLAFARPSSAA